MSRRDNYKLKKRWEDYGDLWMTPERVAIEIIEYFKPYGKILEPCKGTGNFYRNLEGADWCEISEGRDFFLYSKKMDWIITNPPYSILSKFMEKCWKVADNVVLLVLAGAIWNSYKRVREWKREGMGLHTLYCLKPPPELPQIGRPFAAVYWKRDYDGPVEMVNEGNWGEKREKNPRQKKFDLGGKPW